MPLLPARLLIAAFATAAAIQFAVPAVFAQSAPSGNYDEPYRPRFHFSPRINWTNDPNGLVYFEGEYHLFFQYDPTGIEGRHKSWGHAVSADLTHWEELPVAILETDGIQIYTGSVVVDERNTSGFCTGGKACLVAIYTGDSHPAGVKGLETQNLAYSNDRGRTWTKYKANPVLDLHMKDFRDPKVFWSQAGGRWTMAVALPDEHKVRFYGSPDLKTWEPMSDFGPEGAMGGQWECPEIFELPVEGRPGETRWVLKIGLNPGSLQGGSGEQYFVGSFDGKRFVNANPPEMQLWTDYGKDCYCALTFNGLPKNQNAVMLGWMSNWQYANRLPTKPWRGQMTFPRRLALRDTGSGLRLIQMPADAILGLREDLLQYGNKPQQELNSALALEFEEVDAPRVDINSEFVLGDAQEVGWRVLGKGDAATVIGYDRVKQELFVDRTKSGWSAFSKLFPVRVSAPLKLEHAGHVELRILVDDSSVEVFAERGQIAITMLVFPKPDSGTLQVYATGGKPGPVKASVAPLKPVW